MGERRTEIEPRAKYEGPGVLELSHPNYQELSDLFGIGYITYGWVTRERMIREFRRHYELAKAEAERALALTDDELVVTTYNTSGGPTKVVT